MILWADKSPTNLAEEYVSPWTVLRDAYSRNKKFRLRAVETIAAYKAWNGELLTCGAAKRLSDLYSSFYGLFAIGTVRRTMNSTSLHINVLVCIRARTAVWHKTFGPVTPKLECSIRD